MLQGEDDLASHGVHVAQGVGCGDGPELVSGIHDGRKEIDRLHDGLFIVEPVDGRVVHSAQTDGQGGICSGRKYVSQLAQDLRQCLSGHFRRSAGA